MTDTQETVPVEIKSSDYSITLDDLTNASPCSGRLQAVTAAIKTWPATADDAFAASLRVSDVLWIGFVMARRRHDGELRRRLLHALADIAETALPVFDAARHGDDRPRKAINSVRLLAEGKITARAAADAADAAYAARAAADAAYAAAYAARAKQKAIICRWLSCNPPVPSSSAFAEAA